MRRWTAGNQKSRTSGVSLNFRQRPSGISAGLKILTGTRATLISVGSERNETITVKSPFQQGLLNLPSSDAISKIQMSDRPIALGAEANVPAMAAFYCAAPTP